MLLSAINPALERVQHNKRRFQITNELFWTLTLLFVPLDFESLHIQKRRIMLPEIES